MALAINITDRGRGVSILGLGRYRVAAPLFQRKGSVISIHMSRACGVSSGRQTAAYGFCCYHPCPGRTGTPSPPRGGGRRGIRCLDRLRLSRSRHGFRAEAGDALGSPVIRALRRRSR